MEELGHKFRETVNLGILEGYEVVYVDKVESIHALRMDLAIGQRVPAYCTALGKVFLAFFSDEEIQEYCQKTRFKVLTGKTITSAKELAKHLKTIRKEGFAVDDRELDDGIRCIAAPIRNSSGRVAGAISVAGPSLRLTIERMKIVEQPLLETTNRISQKLGYIKL